MKSKTDPAIEAGINATKAATGPQFPLIGANGGFTGSSFDQYANSGQAAGTAPEWTIPLWQKQKVVRPNAVSVGGARFDDLHPLGTTTTREQFIEGDARTQFGKILMDKDLMQQWGQLAWKAGLVNAEDINDATKLGNAWNTAVGWAVNIKVASKGGTEVTPFEAAKMVGQNTGSALLAQQQYAASHFTGDRTTTSTSIDKRQSGQAGDVLHQLLGRNPTAGEKATYQHGLNQVAAAHPETTTSVAAYKDGQQVSQANTVTGGYDAHQAQIDQASANPEVARNQTATTYFDALKQALGAAV